MIKHFLGRIISMIVTLILTSVVVFIIIQLPPGDYAERYAYKLEEAGTAVSEADRQALRAYFGIDRPLYEQYFTWITNIIFHGDFGVSFEYRRPVMDVIGERLGLTTILVIITLILTYGLAIPLGIYSAIKQYSVADYLFSVIAYLGLAIPNFLLALVLLYINITYLGTSVGGLFSAEFVRAPWSFARFMDLLAHLWVPSIILGLAGLGLQMRTMRALMLDEQNKLYVTAARARGLSETKLILKYPARVSINPIVSTLGWELSRVISGAPFVSVVLALPDTGPLYLDALLDQDMYLAGSMLFLMTALTIIGTLVSDLLLAMLDPRIREGGNH
ncbi:MAG: ABC transporter permease [Anaerolineaceae bacterium]